MGDEEKPQVDHLNLKVVTQDGNEIFFKCAAVPPPPAALPDLRASRCAAAEIFAGSLTRRSACRRCKKTTALSKLMNAFCQRQGVNLNAVRFLFDGTRINSDQTPEGLEMEDGDVIDVMVEQQGGGRRSRQ